MNTNDIEQERAALTQGGRGMSYPEWGTALIGCANLSCGWRGLETELIPDPAPKVAPRGRMTTIEYVCPRCKKWGYYFVGEKK